MKSDLLLKEMMQSERNGGMHRYNTMQEFFNIELENENLRDQLYEVQSTFTATD